MIVQGAPARSGRGGFTLMELIVVMAAIALLLAVAVPSFSAMIASQRRSLAQTQLQAAVVGARTLALQQFRGTDTAAVFTFEPGGQLTIVTCVQVGTMVDMVADDPDFLVDRDIFVPTSAVQPVSLPNGWMVRGLITGNDRSALWYANAPDDRSTWVFPETGLYDKTSQLDGEDRQSFMIRFEGGTGRVSADTTESLALLRRPSSTDRTAEESALYNAEDPARFIKLRLGDLNFVRVDDPIIIENRGYMLGNVSSDTVLVKPAWALAVYRERELAIALGTSMNNETGSLYEPGTEPVFGTTASPLSLEEASDWLETQDLSGMTAFRQAVPGGLLFALNRADGTLVDLIEDAPRDVGAP